MMPCRCKNNTLGIFIRSVVQIDLSATSRSTAGRPQRPAFKPASTTRHLRTQPLIPRFYSTSTADSASQPVSESTKSEEDGTHKLQEAAAANGAFVEFSMEAIDALAAEAESEEITKDDFADESGEMQAFKPMRETSEAFDELEDPDEIPLNALFKDEPKRKQRPADGPRVASRSIFREPDSKYYTNGPKEKVKEPKDDWVPPPKEPWMIYKEILKKKFPDGYQPLKRLSPDAIAGIRALHAQMPEKYTTWVLSQEFEVSPEAIRRILKSKWQPDAEEETDRMQRWFKRGEKVWGRYAELGVKPPKKWRDMGIGQGKPEWLLKRNAKFKYEVPPLPALITTARRKEEKSREASENDFGSLVDKIL